jgi:SlyX protein
MPDSLESRLAELEIKLSYTDDLIETLNRAVFRQQEQIEHLLRGMRALREQQQSVAGENAQSDPRNETPPHY